MKINKEILIDCTKVKLDSFIKYLTEKSNDLAKLQRKPTLEWEYNLDESIYTLKSDPTVSIKWTQGLCSFDYGWRSWIYRPYIKGVVNSFKHSCSKARKTVREAMLDYEDYMEKDI